MVAPSLISTYVVTAAAMVTASAAVAGAAYLRSIADTVAENRERSTRNRRHLTGKNTPHEGVMSRLRDVEETVAQHVRQEDPES